MTSIIKTRTEAGSAYAFRPSSVAAIRQYTEPVSFGFGPDGHIRMIQMAELRMCSGVVVRVHDKIPDQELTVTELWCESITADKETR